MLWVEHYRQLVAGVPFYLVPVLAGFPGFCKFETKHHRTPTPCVRRQVIVIWLPTIGAAVARAAPQGPAQQLWLVSFVCLQCCSSLICGSHGVYLHLNNRCSNAAVAPALCAGWPPRQLCMRCTWFTQYCPWSHLLHLQQPTVCRPFRATHQLVLFWIVLTLLPLF